MLKYIICVLFISVLLYSCSSHVEQKEPLVKSPLLTIQDEMGRSLVFDTIPQRILPLCASSMEFLEELCDTADIIARTPECQAPDWVLRKPVVTNYPLDLEKILRLKPDLIVSKEGMISNEHIHKLESLGFKIYMQKQNSIEEIVKSLSKLGMLLGKEEKGAQKAMLLQAQFDRLKGMCEHHLHTAVALIGTDPLYVYGYTSYMTDVFRYVGLRNAIDSAITQRYPVVDQEYLLKLNPDVLILPLAEKETQAMFLKYPVLQKMKAYQQKHCLYLDDNVLSRPSPKLLHVVEYMATEICRHEKK